MSVVNGTVLGDGVAAAINGINPMSGANLAILKSYWEPIAAAMIGSGLGGISQYSILQASFAHGVQVSGPHGFSGGAPTLAYVLGCDGGLSVEGTPVLVDLGSGNLGVTVRFAGANEVQMSTHNNGSQTIPVNATTTVAFGSVDYDTAAGWSIANNNYTIPSSGKYLVSSAVFLNGLTYAASAATYEVQLLVNGSNVDRINRQTLALVASEWMWRGTVIRDFTAGQTVSIGLAVPNNTGANGTIAADGLLSYLQIAKLAHDASLSANVTLMLLKQ